MAAKIGIGVILFMLIMLGFMMFDGTKSKILTDIAFLLAVIAVLSYLGYLLI